MWSLWQFLGAWICISAIPYAMYVVAYVFESRLPGNGPGKIPIWRNQSRALFPGDFGLSLFATAGLCLHVGGASHDWTSQWWVRWLIGPLLSLVVFYLGRRTFYSASSYSEAAWRSPSKRYHDYVMYLLFPFGAIWWVLPGYMTATGPRADLVVLAGVGGLLVWIGGLIADGLQKQVPNEFQHPSVWQPIWVTRNARQR